MIVIKGRTSEDAEGENKAAISLKEKILKQWPEIDKEDNKDSVQIIVEPYLDAGSVKTADLVIIANFKSPKEINFNFPLVKYKQVEKKEGEDLERPIEISLTKVFLKNFVCAVEVKNHSKNKIEYKSGDVLVETFGKWSNATAQNQKQHYALAGHVKQNSQVEPFVTGFVYLNRINEVPKGVGGVYCRDQSFLSMLAGICGHMLRMSSHTKINFQHKSALLQCVSEEKMELISKGSFFLDLKPTEIDSKRMLQIARKVDRKWFEDIGKKMVIFRGLGGTGKTVRLLQIAHELYLEHEAKTVLFTYNWSLLANIRRLLQLMGIPEYKSQTGRGAIRLESVMSFISKILIAYGFIAEEDSILDVYEEKVEEFEKYITSETLSQEELRREMREILWEKYDEATDFEYAFVDEGQDWYSGEKTILMTLFGPEKIVIAHGNLQETRGEGIEWSQGLARETSEEEGQFKVHALTAGVRMTPNLGEFVRSFANRTLLDDQYSRLRINEVAEGGDIYIVEGDYFKNLDLHHRLMESLSINKAEPIDLLHCVPPDDVQSNSHGFHSGVGLKLEGLGFSKWDAVDDVKRRNMPKSINDMRIVQYDSCRGLEGWITFLHEFDDFWEYKKEDVKDEKGQKKLFEDEEDFVNEEVAKWALIALTRSISSTVIQINSKESFIGKVLWELSEKNKDYIQWIKI